jgi:3-hydroxyisobutyrate dehydrogenase-like beta-hydroxyacid dehydrogenase
MTRVALIGLGEVGRTFVEELRAAGIRDLSAWDTAFVDPASPASRNAAELGIAAAGSAPAAVRGADLVVSAVTAAQCVAAAESVTAGIAPRAWFFDLNSSSPGHKQAAAAAVDAAGGRYVEAALMSPIGPKRLGSPFLLGGPHAAEFAATAGAYGITSVEVVSDEVGRAAATKLCRSVIVKGLESLLAESLLTARTFGVERDVLDSLPNILPPADWEAVAGYFVSRSLQHGKRRSEEMEEAAATVAEAGVEPHMSLAAVQRQRWAAQFPEAVGAGSTLGMVDAVLAAMRRQPDSDLTDLTDVPDQESTA